MVEFAHTTRVCNEARATLEDSTSPHVQAKVADDIQSSDTRVTPLPDSLVAPGNRSARSWEHMSAIPFQNKSEDDDDVLYLNGAIREDLGMGGDN